MKTIILFTICATAFGASRDLAKPCSAVYPVAVKTMLAAKFEPKISDAAGGVLSMTYAGAQFVDSAAAVALGPTAGPNYLLEKTNDLLVKYVADGDKRKNAFVNFAFGKATFAFAPGSSGRCSVDLVMEMTGFGYSRRTGDIPVPLPSNGTAETEFLDRIAKAAQ